MNAQTLIQANVAEFVQNQAQNPIVDDIDRKGYHTETFMRELGAISGLGAVGTEAEDSNGLRLTHAESPEMCLKSAKNAAQPLSVRGVRRLAHGICTKCTTTVKDKYISRHPAIGNMEMPATEAMHQYRQTPCRHRKTQPPSRARGGRLHSQRRAYRGCPTSAKTTFERIPPKSAATTSAFITGGQ